jgi:hypothetical protein
LPRSKLLDYVRTELTFRTRLRSSFVRFKRALNRKALQNGPLRRSRIYAFFLIATAGIGLPTSFLTPYELAGSIPPTAWDTSLGTAAQVIGGATAVVFALLVVPVQNAAAKYSPIFLSYIRRDRYLWGVLIWTLVALTYALAALGIGATPARVATASFLTVTVILALGWAALRVMKLLNPIELVRLVEFDALRRLPHLMNGERRRFDADLRQLEKSTGVDIPDGIRHYPAPETTVNYLLNQIYPLLSIASGAISAAQVDVLGAALSSVTNMVHVYLEERNKSCTVDDPVLSRVSEEFFTLFQTARGAASQQNIPEITRALGRLADSAVSISTPGSGVGENNVALIPLGYLRTIALATMSNVNSTAPAVAADHLGRVIHGLLVRRLSASTAHVVQRDLWPVMGSALQPGAYHVAAIGGKWLMYIWTYACSIPTGEYVRRPLIDVVEAFLKEYRSQPITDERRMAIAPLLDPLVSNTEHRPLPAGAATAAGLLSSNWPPKRLLIDDVQRFADRLIREIVWPGTTRELQDELTVNWAMEQAVEVAVLLAAIANRSIRHPLAHDKSDEEDSELIFPDERAAEAWNWLTRVLIGACGKLTEISSGKDIGRQQWRVFHDALTGASACIFAAIVTLQDRPSDLLEHNLGVILDELITLSEDIVREWDDVQPTNPVIQHLRLVGAAATSTGYEEHANRIAGIIARVEINLDLDRHRFHRRIYPSNDGYDRWAPPTISVIGQLAVPNYLPSVQDLVSNAAHDRFENLIMTIRDSGQSHAQTPAQDE